MFIPLYYINVNIYIYIYIVFVLYYSFYYNTSVYQVA